MARGAKVEKPIKKKGEIPFGIPPRLLCNLLNVEIL